MEQEILIGSLLVIASMGGVVYFVQKNKKKKDLPLENLFKALDIIDRPPDVKLLNSGQPETKKWNIRMDYVEIAFMVFALINTFILIWIFRNDLSPLSFNLPTLILFFLLAIIGFCVYRIVARFRRKSKAS